MRALPLLLTLLLLSACSSSPDLRPQVYKDGTRHLDQGIRSYRQGNYTLAAQLFNQALSEYSSVDDVDGIQLAHINLAETALRTGHLAAADRHLHQLAYIAQREQDPRHQLRLGYLRARLLSLQGDNQQAEQQLASLLTEPLEGPGTDLTAAWMLRTRLAQQQTSVQHEKWLEQTQQQFDELSSSQRDRLAPYLWQLQARKLSLDGEQQQALALLGKALQALRKRAERPGIAAMLEDMAGIHQANGDYARAEDHLHRALLVRIWMLDRPGTRQGLQQLLGLYQQADWQDKPEPVRQWLEQSREHSPDDWTRLKQLLKLPFYGGRFTSDKTLTP